MRDHGFGVWVARSMLLNSAGVENMISKLQEISAGRAYVQVVGRGDSQYSSGILPRAEELDGPFDGLSKTIETARGSGLKISAWMNVNLVWKFGDRPSSKDHVVNSNPEWITCDERGLSMLEYSSCDIEEVFGPFIDPGIPQVRRFTAEIADELASYDVEEVHLDFIRYPFRTFGYTQAALHEYRRWLRAANLKNTEENFDRFRIESTGEQVRLIREKVRSRGKKLSCAVFDDYSERAVKERLQPWLEWLEDGLIDSAVVKPQVVDCDDGAGGRSLEIKLSEVAAVAQGERIAREGEIARCRRRPHNQPRGDHIIVARLRRSRVGPVHGGIKTRFIVSVRSGQGNSCGLGIGGESDYHDCHCRQNKSEILF